MLRAALARSAMFRLARLPGAAARAEHVLLAERLTAFMASPQERHELDS